MHLKHKYLSIWTKFLLPKHSKNSMRHYGNKCSGDDQIGYLNWALETNLQDWSILKNNILNKPGVMNEKNVDGVIIKTMVRNRKLDSALSFANHLKSVNLNLSMGATNGILSLYYEMAKEKPLSEPEKQFILSTYNDLYAKFQVLDFTTAEILLHALCAIDDWKKALKVLNDIKVSGTPSHSAYSTLIGTLFRNNKEKEAMMLISNSLSDLRPLQHYVYKEWIEYIRRKYKSKDKILKNLEKISLHISANFAVISEKAAVEIKKNYLSLGWRADFVKIDKKSFQCLCCNDTLKCFKLTKEEFELLHKNIKDKLIIGSDLFLKTSPKEIQSFMSFVDRTAPYDIVLDALNIGYTLGKSSNIDRMGFLKTVVDHFNRQNKRILLLGRKHMLRWHNKSLEYLMSKTCSFFTEDISQDDPFFITAAILSGPHTDIVSKDLLRGHKFMLKDQVLKQIFQRWQWEHQWKVFLAGKRFTIQPPLQFTPCAQKNQEGWHLPFERVTVDDKGLLHDGIPDYDSWLCIRPNNVK
ncbi:mitochondrial ribonuclease P catalytic subunit [Battus philenor]|uniref:mitochondrial ribonuclease P catalytic subunit n=1 Tax=Battus philenor TaxID=42288 RepID=UPI0035CF65A3